MRKVCLLSFLLLVAACADDLPASSLGQATNLQIGTELAGPDTFLGQLPVAFVLLKPDPANPNSADTPRNRAFCNAFIQGPTAASIQAQNLIAQNIVRTRWPLTVSTAASGSEKDCNFLIANYATSRAANIIQNVQLTQGSFAGQGPFLVVINGREVTADDGSTATDFNAYVGNWNKALNAANGSLAASAASTGTSSLWQQVTRFFLAILGQYVPVVNIIVGFIKGAIC